MDLFDSHGTPYLKNIYFVASKELCKGTFQS